MFEMSSTSSCVLEKRVRMGQVGSLSAGIASTKVPKHAFSFEKVFSSPFLSLSFPLSRKAFSALERLNSFNSTDFDRVFYSC